MSSFSLVALSLEGDNFLKYLLLKLTHQRCCRNCFVFKQAFLLLLEDLQQNILTLMLPCLGVQASGSLIAQELVETNAWHRGSDANMSLSSSSCGHYKMWDCCAGGCCQEAKGQLSLSWVGV